MVQMTFNPLAFNDAHMNVLDIIMVILCFKVTNYDYFNEVRSSS